MRELEIDWTALHSAFQTNMPEVRCYLSVKDGSVLKLQPGDPQIADVRAHPEQYVAIEAVPSRIQYQWLDQFIRTVEDEALRKRLEAAVNGKGAFRRFKDILLTLPDERRRWFEFRDELMRVRVVEWVREQGLLALNEPDWTQKAATTAAPAGPANNPRDIEALRDLLIEWFEGKDKKATTPLALEELARRIGDQFKLKAL